MSDQSDLLLKRIEELEHQVSALSAAATYTYIALMSIPPDITKQDPDFAKSETEIKAALNKFFAPRAKSDA